MPRTDPIRPDGGPSNRREFLQRSAAAALVLSGGTTLAACGTTGTSASSGVNGIPLARPDRPVRLPISANNPAVASGLNHEPGPLNIYMSADYINPKVVKAFNADLGVQTSITPYISQDEAIAKFLSGKVSFDLLQLSTANLTKMVAANLAQPLNHSYLSNFTTNIIPQLASPFYDQGSQYTVPYTLYKIGIGYRTDHIKGTPDSYTNPYDIFWDAGYAKGKVGIYDDARDGISLALLRRQVDLNTEDPKAIQTAKQDLLQLESAVNLKIGYNDYQGLPKDDFWLHQAWAGNLIYAAHGLPPGVPTDVLGFFYPDKWGGEVGNDIWLVPRGAKNPVLAHAFLNFLYDEKQALVNFTFVGFQPPLKSITPQRLVSGGYVPKNLTSTVILPEEIANGKVVGALTPKGDALWQDAWSAIKAGHA